MQGAEVLLFPAAEVAGEFPGVEEALSESFLDSSVFGSRSRSIIVLIDLLKHAEGQDDVFYGAAARKIGDNSWSEALVFPSNSEALQDWAGGGETTKTLHTLIQYIGAGQIWTY